MARIVEEYPRNGLTPSPKPALIKANKPMNPRALFARLSEKPSAVVSHAGICEGDVEQSAFLPQSPKKMIYPSESRILITQDRERLVILDVDSRCRLVRILISFPLIFLGLFMLYVVFSGAGMAEAVGVWQLVSKILFLGVIGLIFGLIPLAVGLRLWLIREEIVIYSFGGLDKCFLLGSLRFGRVSIQPVTSADFRINTWRGTKTGTNHEVILRSNTAGSEIRLLSFKAKSDAEQWLERVSFHLVPDSTLKHEATSREWQPAITSLVESELDLAGATTHRC
jgi:hypothetical protein